MRGRYIIKSFPSSEKFTDLWSFGREKDQLNGFIWNAFYNGLGRHVPQLSRVTLKFCKNTRMSKGARDFIENDLVDFCREHPGIAFYVTARRMKSPVLVCEYLNGSYHWQSVHAMSRQKIKLWLDFYASRCGEPIKVIRKPTTSVWPSVQGPWNPFLNKPTECNIMQFPNEERGRFISRKVSATEQLSQMAKNGQLKNILFSKKES